MKLLACLTAILLMASPVAAADFQKGVAAYKRGDYATEMKEWRPLAEQGYANAQFNLGLMYDKGKGVPQDYAAAARWYRKAAEQGHVGAQFNLGFIYSNGKGVPQDYAAAVRWHRKAAEQGHVAAQLNLGVAYAKGEGVPQDFVQAHKWWNLAATSGHKKAIKNRDIIAKLMTPADISKAQKLAREWFAKLEEK
jgi:TPR repeat protein